MIASKNEAQLSDKQNVMVVPFLSGKKMLLNYIDKMEKSKDGITMLWETADEKVLFKEYRSLYKVIKAAGGICRNKKEEILFIKRLGVWDLPKGKIDEGEQVEEAAVREVLEETGVSVQIGRKVGSTWHTYFDRKGRRILKKTYWFAMEIERQPVVKIQEEENITDYQWMLPQDFLADDLPTYQSIKEIMQKYAESER